MLATPCTAFACGAGSSPRLSLLRTWDRENRISRSAFRFGTFLWILICGQFFSLATLFSAHAQASASQGKVGRQTAGAEIRNRGRPQSGQVRLKAERNGRFAKAPTPTRFGLRAFCCRPLPKRRPDSFTLQLSVPSGNKSLTTSAGSGRCIRSVHSAVFV